MPGLSYRQVKDLYDTLKSSGATSVSLPEWSQQMNDLTGTDLYSQGQNDNVLKRGSVALDRALEFTGLPAATRGFGETVGNVVGNPSAGADIGEGLPRSAVNMLPYLIPGAGWGAAAGRLGGAALLSGAEAYTRTGSPASGLVSGGIAAALPKGTDLVEQAILKRLGVAPLEGSIVNDLVTGPGGQINRLGTEQVKRYIGDTFGQKATAFAGGQLAASGAMEGQRWGEEYFSGEPLHNPFTTENLLNLTLGQLPFAAIHGIGKLRGAPDQATALREAFAYTEKKQEEKRAQDALASQTDIERIPKIDQPELTPEGLQAILERRSNLRTKQNDITSKVSMTPEDAADLNDAVLADQSTPFVPTATSALGAEQGGEHVPVVGTQIHETAKWRKILVADDPSNPPELRGQVVEYSKGLREPPPTKLGEDSPFTTFGVTSDPLWRTVKTPEEEANRQMAYEAARVARKQGTPTAADPELPTQANPATDPFSHITELDKIETAVDAARTPAQKQQAILALRNLQERAGFSEFSDTQLKRIVSKLVDQGSKGDLVNKALKIRLARDRRALVAQTEKERALKTAGDWYAQELAKGDQGENVPLLNEFKNFSENVVTRGVRGSTLVDSGELVRMFHGLKDDPNAMERLKAQTEEVLRTGKGLIKQRPVLDDIKEHVVDNPDGEPVRNILAESALQAIQNKQARQEFDSWDRKSETNWDYEKRTFVDWVDEFGPPEKSDLNDAAEFFADRDGVPVTEVKDELKDFLERPHVKTWLNTLEVLVTDKKAHAPIPQQIPSISAGGDFIWGLAGYDPTTNKLGSKHTLPKSAELTPQQFLSMAGRGKPLNVTELETAKLLVPEAFDAKGNVNVRKLYELLPQRQPVTSVSYGMEGKQSEAKMELDKMTHEWWDVIGTKKQNQFNLALSDFPEHGPLDEAKLIGRLQEKNWTQEEIAKAIQFDKLQTTTRGESTDPSSPRATSYYRQISPFDTTKWPVLRVDVALPEGAPKYLRERMRNAERPEATREEFQAAQDAYNEGARDLWSPDNLHENLPNTLGWAMVQFPEVNGEKVMFVGEQQSRWGQEKQETINQTKKLWPELKSLDKLPDGWTVESKYGGGVRTIYDKGLPKAHGKTDEDILTSYNQGRKEQLADTESGVIGGIPPHPLLDAQHVLVLKALIAEAQKRGISKMVISDAESAMMTEMLDKRNVKKVPSREEGIVEQDKLNKEGYKITLEKEGNDYFLVTTDKVPEGFQPRQAKGFYLAYDLTLPSALRKLTGDQGEKVELGTHKNAVSNSIQEEAAGFGDDEGFTAQLMQHRGQPLTKTVVGSPVFRNLDGTPKSSVTGTSFDLSSAFSALSSQGGFTLGDPFRAPQGRIPRTFSSDIPSAQEQIDKLTTDGHGLVEQLLTDSDPSVVAIAKDLQARFPEALSRIDSGVYEVPGSYAARRPAGRVGIFLDRSIPELQGYSRNNVILHELIHGLTLHELANPKVDPKVIQELTDLRNRLIEALPAKLKTKLQEALDSNWYERFAQGEADMHELHPNQNYAQVLYSLLNNDELASQGFSSRSVREYMQSVGGKKTNGWQTFTNWVKNLLGMKEQVGGTAFGDFLATTSQLMANGEWLADFANFGERYMESQGRGGTLGRAQTQRALGIVADSSHGLDEPLTIASSLDLSASKNDSNLELKRARRDYNNLLRDSPDEAIHVNNVLAELGHKDIDSMVTSAIGEGQDIHAALDLLPPEASSYVYAKLRDAKDVLDIIRAASSDKNKGMTNLADPKLLSKTIKPVLKEVNQALKHETFLTQMATDLGGLSAVTPEGLIDALPHMAPKAYEDFIEGAKDVAGKSASWFSKYLEPMGQWARRVPEVAEAVSKGFQLQANSRKMFHEAVKWLGMDTSSEYVDVLTHESVKQTEQALANPKLADRIHQWMYWNNKKGGDAVTMLPDNDPDIAKLLSGLSDSEKATVHDVVAKGGKVTQMMNAQKLEKMQQISATNGAGLAALTSGLKTRDNVALSGQLLEGIQKSSDPMTSNDGMVMIQNVQQRMQPESFIELYDFLKGEADKIKLWKQYFDANPFWATAQRTERYLIKARNAQGKPKTLQASSIKEAQDIGNKKGYKLDQPPIDQWAGKEDEPFSFPNMSPAMAKRMQEIEQNQLSMLSKVLSPEQLAEVQRTSPVTQILREAASQQSIPQVAAPPRLLSQGAEELPWMWNHISWAQRESNYWSRQLLRAQARTYLKDVEIRDNPEMVDRLEAHFENLLRPDPKIAQQMTRFASTWFLGFNPATVLINAAQPFVTHVSEMTALTGKPIDSYRRVLNALNEISGKFAGGKDWATREHEMLMHDAAKDGEVGLGMFDDEAAAQESIATNYKRAMKKEAPQTLGERLGTLAGAYSTAGMWMFRHGEQVNSRAGLLAGFDYYREQGLNYSEAKEKAYEYNHAVNLGGGRAQRSVGVYSSNSPFLRGAAMLGTSLQGYVLGTTAQIVRHLQRGFFRPQGLTPHETFAARRAAIQMLATQFAAAGVLGMPFVSGALALLDKAFPELELNQKTREFVNSFLKGDGENGSTLTDMAMTGVPSMFGWDMQSRLSMGNTLPGVSEVNGFQPENLMGPVANIVHNFTNGVQGWVKGDAKAGLNFLPPSVKKLLQASQAALTSGQPGGGIQDYQGRPLANPTHGEELGAFLGFQPKRLSDQNAAARMLTQSEEVLRTQESRFRSQQAEQVLKGNFGTVRQELLARKQENKTYDDVGAVQAIARASEELAFPRDLRREGTQPGSAARSVLLGTYGTQGGSSEVQRLGFRKQIEQKLGLVSNDPNEVKIAMLMDQLKLKDPNATRLQLKSAALEAFRRASPRTLQSPQVFQ